jgi:hypothetical protein
MTLIGFTNTAQSEVSVVAYQSGNGGNLAIEDTAYDKKIRNTCITKGITAEK